MKLKFAAWVIHTNFPLPDFLIVWAFECILIRIMKLENES
jgi:hypothetical protein